MTKDTKTLQNHKKRSVRMLIGFWLAYIVSVIACLGFPILVMPLFENLFSNFGADLPAFTLFTFQYRYSLSFIPVLILGFAFFVTFQSTLTEKAHKNCKTALIASLFAPVISVILMIIAMYLPIFKMGSAIG